MSEADELIEVQWKKRVADLEGIIGFMVDSLAIAAKDLAADGENKEIRIHALTIIAFCMAEASVRVGLQDQKVLDELRVGFPATLNTKVSKGFDDAQAWRRKELGVG